MHCRLSKIRSVHTYTLDGLFWLNLYNFFNFQVSLRDRELTYCNEDRKIPDTTKNYIVNLTRPDPGERTTENSVIYDQILDNYETNQVRNAKESVFCTEVFFVTVYV